MLWFGVQLPNLGLEIFERYRFGQDNRPTVVTESQKIYLANSAAREVGIQLGKSLATARSIYPEIVHYTRDCDAEAERLEQLVGVAYEFTPSVSQDGSNGLLLELRGSLKLLGGVHSATQRMTKRFRESGHAALMGIAHTPRAALIFAQSPINQSWSDYPTAEETYQIAFQQLQETPLSHLDLSLKDRDRLVNMGLKRVGELLDIPRHELVKRFSAELVEYLAQLTGELLDPWDVEQPTEIFNEQIHLLDPIRGKDEVLEPMEHLVTNLGQWLDRLQLGVRELRWGVYTFEGDGTTFEVNFEQPRYECADIMAITRLRMEVIDLPEEAMTVSLEATRAESRSRNWVTQDILGGSLKQTTPPRELIERLVARLGAQALQQFQILEDHRPEFAWKPCDSDMKSRSVTRIPDCGRRPLWLLEPPKQIKEEHLYIVSGPERIQSGWWDIEQQRDYYIARDRSGAWCWCFRDAQGWFLHGYFA